jgi:hypothetical protein
MLLSLWGKRWKEVQLVMSNLFTAYIDDSGTDPVQEVAIATGLIIPAAKIVALDNEWGRLKKKWGFKCFHMSAFSARNGKEEPQFAKWNDYQHKKVYELVRKITKKYGVMTVSFAVNKKDYDEVVPDELKRFAGRFHYSWAVRQFISYIHEWRKRHSASAPLQYVFDWITQGDPRRVEIDEIMEQAEFLSGGTGEYKDYAFADDCKVPGLQCADMLAWISYQSALLVYIKKPFYADARIGWEDLYKHGSGKWRYTLAIKREGLARWAQSEKVKGIALARFEAWEEFKRLQEGNNAKRRVR